MNTTTTVPAKRIGATALGYPRIGPNRELKRALEAHWSGRLDAEGLEAAAAAVRAGMLDDLSVLDSVPTGTFSLYDHVLDTIVAVDALAPRHRRETALASYFAAARGDEAAVPLEMTKWFDTNYHYLVPEIGPETSFAAKPDKAIAEFLEATARGLDARPVLLGPVSFLLLAKPSEDAPADFAPFDRLDDLVEVYAEILTALGRAGAGLIQLDEPALCADRTPEELAATAAAYRRLVGVAEIVVAGGYGPFGEALPVLLEAGVEGIALDLVRGRSDLGRHLRHWMFHVKHACSPAWSTAATSGAPTSPKPMPTSNGCRASAIGWASPPPHRSCTCPSTSTPSRTCPTR